MQSESNLWEERKWNEEERRGGEGGQAAFGISIRLCMTWVRNNSVVLCSTVDYSDRP